MVFVEDYGLKGFDTAMVALKQILLRDLYLALRALPKPLRAYLDMVIKLALLEAGLWVALVRTEHVYQGAPRGEMLAIFLVPHGLSTFLHLGPDLHAILL